jgi:hypothetical protein
MVNWDFNERVLKSIEDFKTLNCFGFVYKILFEDYTEYIGKFQLVSITSSNPLKNGRKRETHLKYRSANKNGKRVVLEDYITYRNPINYIGSFDKSKFKNNEPISREIIGLALNKISLTYLETKMLFEHGVLEKPNSFRNENILGKFYGVDKLNIQY